MIEDQVRNYDIDGIMWCNERNSPLDQMMQGQAPGDFSSQASRARRSRGASMSRRVAARCIDDVRIHAGGACR